MRVEVAKHAGICYGVERALRLAEEASVSGGEVHTLGPLIHNPQAVAALRQKGVEVATSLDDVGGGTLVIRSHGVEPAIIEEAIARGLNVVDATCPHVSKAHEAAAELSRDGYIVVIVGEADHPEVEGILAHASGEAIVVSSAEELPERQVVEAILPRASELRVFNTICSATSKRQQSAEELAETVDVMVVVGGHNSGNTTRLVQICDEVNSRVHHVETPDDLDPAWFDGATSVGVTAGASTPDEQMQAVIRAIEAIA